MMELIHWTDPRLRAPNAPVEAWTGEIAECVRRMFKVMREAEGVGLAAPQVGWNARLFVANLTGLPEDELVFWNPQIIVVGRAVPDTEGCLSYPGMPVRLARAQEIMLRAQTPAGPVERTFRGFAAKAIQHETDHVNGITILEKIDAAERKRVDRKLKTLA